MKKLFLTSLAVLASASTASALDLTPYAAVRGGFDRTIMNTDTMKVDGMPGGTMGNPAGNGFMFSAATGASIFSNKYFAVRGEVEYSYAHNSLKRSYLELGGEEPEGEDESEPTTQADDDGESPTPAEGEGGDDTPAAGDDTPAAGQERTAEVSAEKDKWSRNAHTLMLNAYVDFNTDTAFTPYVSAGLGYAWNNAKLKEADGNIKFDDSAFAWQVGAGVSYAVNELLNIDLGYRFMDVMGLKYSKTIEGNKYEIKNDTYSHQVYVGARYAF